jgi:hypothetical protein
MAKNMTRRGLAFGAAATLAVTGISALPAQAVGIANDLVVINDTEEFDNYNMLSTGYIELDGSFAFAAESGGELKFYVSDPGAISVFDVVPETPTSDTITLSSTAIGSLSALHSATGDIVTLNVATDGTAHDVEVGDAILIASVADSNFTVADINGYQTVTRVTALGLTTAASGAIATAVYGTGTGGLDKITLAVNDASGLAAGDVITVALGAGSAAGGTGTLADSEMEGTFLVESVSGNNVIYSANTGLTAGTGTWTSSGAGTVVSDSISFVPGTEVTATQIAVDPLDTNGTVTETTSSAALDTVAELRGAAFGAAGVVTVATARSTTAGTIGDYVVDTNEENASQGDQVVRFATASDATVGSIVVTAWIDTDDDGVIDATENVSDPVTVTFVAPSAATYTITAGDLYIGTGTGIEGRVTADLNLAEIGSQSLLTIDSTLIDNSAGAPDPSSQGAQTLGYDTVNEWLDAAITLDFAVAASDSVTLTVKSGGAAVGSAATYGVGALTVAGSVLSIPATANNTRAYNEDANGTAMSSQAVTVRKGAASVAGSVTVYDDDPTDTTADDVVANVPYTISITSSSVTAADGVKFNGKVVDGGTETITGYTNASGQIALSLTQTAADAGDVVTVEIDVQGLDKTALMAFTYALPDYDVVDSASELTSSTEYNTTIAVGGTLTRTYKVADQFGAAPANGDVVVAATRSGSRTVLAATWSYQVPVVDGVATVTIVDNGTGTGSDTVTVKTYPVLAGGGLDSADDSNTYTLAYALSAADVTPTGVTAVVNHDGIDDTLTNDKAVALEPDALVNYDSRATAGANPPAFETYNVDADGDGSFTDAGSAQLTLSGTVSNALGGVVPGALVTISGQGVAFKFTTGGSGTVYAVDSITVRTGAAGTYSVDVFGGTGGLKTLTATAGSATASDEVTFVAGGAVAAFTLTAPGASEPGKTVDVSVSLVDAYGNPVQGSTITLSSTGPGYLLNTTGTTLATGKYNTKLLVGSNDSGTAVITATVTIAGVETTKTASIVIGVGAVAAADQKVNAGSFKGFVALYAKGYAGKKMTAIVAGKWLKVDSLASNFERVVRYTGAGYDIVTKIYIDGVEKGTFNLTTK